jgi:hypothetical protein
MIRTLLKEEMACVSGTSHRLQASAAKIYYPRFYISLLLYGSFNRAAANAQLTLRKNKKIHKNEERYDHYVHWNWLSTQNLREELASHA